ncbi:GntR family transcriptional regulator [Cupriavidus basilensis OR16]|uniref:GntR family transcriptional regulator n=1 Tax=Cupriavidus basilensis OR16 TaxID=1127483 RepID=H1S5X8_9BURK|nr:GntR family transcriptional regulator [Cupriavidus basilensis OR16]
MIQPSGALADDEPQIPLPRSPSIATALADSIERQIVEGAYRTGDKLAAFEILVARALVEPRRGSGYFVLERPAKAPRDEDAGSLRRAMDIVWLMREQLKSSPDVLAVGDGFPPVAWLSEARLDKYHHKVVRTGLGALFRYGNRFGYGPLRDHLVRKLGDLGIGADPRQIVLTHGANDAIDLVIRYFLPAGATVLVDDPGYYPLFGKLKLAGVRIVGVPRLADGPDLEALEQLLIQERPRLFFTQSVAHNPTEVRPAAGGKRCAGGFQAHHAAPARGAGPARADPLYRQLLQILLRGVAGGIHCLRRRPGKRSRRSQGADPREQLGVLRAHRRRDPERRALPALHHKAALPPGGGHRQGPGAVRPAGCTRLRADRAELVPVGRAAERGRLAGAGAEAAAAESRDRPGARLPRGLRGNIAVVALQCGRGAGSQVRGGCARRAGSLAPCRNGISSWRR